MPYKDPEVARAAARVRSNRYAAKNREAIREYGATYRLEQAEKESARHARYREENQDKIKEANRKYQERNPENSRMNEAVRRARKLNAFVEYVDPKVVWERDGGICHLCNLPADPNDWHLEHKIAIVNEGEHSYANTAVSHPTCNLRKGKK